MSDERLKTQAFDLASHMRSAAYLVCEWYVNPSPCNTRETQQKLDLVIKEAQEMQTAIDEDTERREAA